MKKVKMFLKKVYACAVLLSVSFGYIVSAMILLDKITDVVTDKLLEWLDD